VNYLETQISIIFRVIRMAEEPQFPPLPDLGEILDRKDRFVPKKITVLNPA